MAVGCTLGVMSVHRKQQWKGVFVVCLGVCFCVCVCVCDITNSALQTLVVYETVVCVGV